MHLKVSLIVHSKCYAEVTDTFFQERVAKGLNNIHLTEGRGWNSVENIFWTTRWDSKTMMSETNKLEPMRTL